MKSAIGSLLGAALKLQIALSSIVVFTVLILPLQEHGIALHLFVLSLISFMSVLKFSEYRSFASIGRFIPRYFILFVVMVSGIVSLISLSDLLLLVHWDAGDFCILILHPAALPNSLMSSEVIFHSPSLANTQSLNLVIPSAQGFPCLTLSFPLCSS